MLRHCSHQLVMVLALAGAVQGCSKDDKKDDAATTTANDGKGSVATASAGSASVDFSAASAGAQFVLMPFILGDPSTVAGANGTTFTFNVSIPGGSAKLTDARPRLVVPPLAAPAPMTALQIDHSLRTLLNRFDPKAGLDQGEGFWKLAQTLDADTAYKLGKVGGAWLADPEDDGSIESFYRNAATAGPSYLSEHFNLATGSCPTVGSEISLPSPADPRTVNDYTIPVTSSVVSNDNYCIVYLSDPVTGGDKATVEATIKEVVRRYKEVIYQDTFATVNGYTYKPVYVVLDFTNAKLWPTAKSYQVSGAFLPKMADDASMPMIYMAADFSKIGSNASAGASYDADLNKRLWHGTIAHETQHSIMDYYRSRVIKNGTAEVASVDEGIAHYVEDLFGHGTENFADFPKPFLQNWYETAIPALHATASESVNRGAGQTLIYYLISQKGGVTFTNGIVSGGGGLQYLSDIVKGAKTIGPQNLADKFGGTWTDTLAGYFGALAIDGSALTATDAKYKVQDPQQVTNLLGKTDASYGMHFNGFSDLPKVHTWDDAVKDGLTTAEAQYYATKPYLYTVTDPTVKVVFKTKDTFANTAVSVIQVK